MLTLGQGRLRESDSSVGLLKDVLGIHQLDRNELKFSTSNIEDGMNIKELLLDHHKVLGDMVLGTIATREVILWLIVL